jgi:hypothetical protein
VLLSAGHRPVRAELGDTDEGAPPRRTERRAKLSTGTADPVVPDRRDREGDAVRDHVLVWRSLATALVLAALDTSSSGSLATVTAAVAAALLVSMLHRTRLLARASAHRTPSVAAPSADERCRRGSFRRQSQADAPGRPLPRAPQPA